MNKNVNDECVFHNNDCPKSMKIADIIEEAEGIKTFFFDFELNADPGQFVLLWIPRLDEKPFSVSYQDEKRFGVTVSKVGSFTEKLFEMKKGDIVGIRGPYGNGFSLDGCKNIALVGGGYGSGPMAFLAEQAVKLGINVHLVIGARNKDLVLFQERFKDSKINAHFCTDDGSCGIKGFTTHILEEIMQKEKIDKVFTCGPEIMMKFVIGICDKHNADCEISLERIMKCGLGVCGSCCLDPEGWRVCKDGPIFTKEQVKKITDFNTSKRDFFGRKIPL